MYSIELMLAAPGFFGNSSVRLVLLLHETDVERRKPWHCFGTLRSLSTPTTLSNFGRVRAPFFKQKHDYSFLDSQQRMPHGKFFLFFF